MTDLKNPDGAEPVRDGRWDLVRPPNPRWWPWWKWASIVMMIASAVGGLVVAAIFDDPEEDAFAQGMQTMAIFVVSMFGVFLGAVLFVSAFVGRERWRREQASLVRSAGSGHSRLRDTHGSAEVPTPSRHPWPTWVGPALTGVGTTLACLIVAWFVTWRFGAVASSSGLQLSREVMSAVMWVQAPLVGCVSAVVVHRRAERRADDGGSSARPAWPAFALIAGIAMIAPVFVGANSPVPLIPKYQSAEAPVSFRFTVYVNINAFTETGDRTCIPSGPWAAVTPGTPVQILDSEGSVVGATEVQSVSKMPGDTWCSITTVADSTQVLSGTGWNVDTYTVVFGTDPPVTLGPYRSDEISDELRVWIR